MEAYCVKCKEKQTLSDPQVVTFRNGRKGRQGACTVCGTKLTIMGGVPA